MDYGVAFAADDKVAIDRYREYKSYHEGCEKAGPEQQRARAGRQSARNQQDYQRIYDFHGRDGQAVRSQGDLSGFL